jgi:Zn finger protein HypA/HybF involved in hydrogenase expression
MIHKLNGTRTNRCIASHATKLATNEETNPGTECDDNDATVDCSECDDEFEDEGPLSLSLNLEYYEYEMPAKQYHEFIFSTGFYSACEHCNGHLLLIRKGDESILTIQTNIIKNQR